jgi:hypothetical protein
MGFFKGGRPQQLYMRSDAHGERMQKVYALDYCAASFVTEGKFEYTASARLLRGAACGLLAPRAPRAQCANRTGEQARAHST